GLPCPYTAEASVLRFGDSYQGFLGNGIDGVIVNIKTEDKSHAARFLVEQRVGLVHRDHPVPRDALMRAIAVTGLITGVRGQRSAVRSRFVSFHRSFAGYPSGVLHDGKVVWQSGIEFHPDHAPERFVPRPLIVL